MNCDNIANHLVGVCSGENQPQTFLTGYMEQIFVCRSASTGVKWKSRRMVLKGIAIADNPGNNEFSPFTVQFMDVKHKVTLLCDMVAGTLYYPSDPSFPLVDIYYLDNDQNLIGIQATVSATHEKCVETYVNFFDKLGTTYKQTKLRTK
jgi:hypothetical protein